MGSNTETTYSDLVLVFSNSSQKLTWFTFFPQMMAIRKLEMLISVIPIMKKEMNILIKTWHSLR